MTNAIRSMRSVPAVLGFTLALAACATTAGSTGNTGSSDDQLGHVEVLADPPRLNTQVITGFNFAVNAKSIAMSAPGNAVGFNFAVTSPDCLRGSMGERLLEFCRSAPASGDKSDVQRWRAATSQATFTTQLSGDGRTLQVEVGRSRGLFALGDGPAIEELRRDPALLGMAFAFGFVPAARADTEDSELGFKFKVSQEP